jgi:hypothetical protein
MPSPTVYRDERTTLCFPSRATGVVQIAYPPRQSGAAAFMGGGVVLCWRVEKTDSPLSGVRSRLRHERFP